MKPLAGGIYSPRRPLMRHHTRSGRCQLSARPRPALAAVRKSSMTGPPLEPQGPNWFDLNWIVAAVSAIVGAVITGFLTVWRAATILTTIRKEIEQNAQDIQALELWVEERHKENVEAQRELVGELRNIRQSIESSYRDLSRRIDDYMDRRH